ncbi:hypothetical protein ABN277_02220 [Enterobacter hormaechei]|uniref:hypothetical protein n=1 Tax=Enterobacter hormaechei TaxID=158836 RepID=UPI0032D9B613
MLSTTELLRLMESQQQESTIDQHTQHTEHLADLESELVTVNRQLSVTRKNIAHYQQLAEQMLKTNPEMFGPEIAKLLRDIATAKVMKDKPELFAELHQLEQRAEQISKEVGK